MKYYICDDDNTQDVRVGGLGSTDRRDKNE